MKQFSKLYIHPQSSIIQLSFDTLNIHSRYFVVLQAIRHFRHGQIHVYILIFLNIDVFNTQSRDVTRDRAAITKSWKGYGRVCNTV